MGLFQMPEAQLVRAWDGETAAADHAWSPSGRYLLMEMDGSVAGSVELAIYDTQADQVSKVTASTGMLIPMSWSPDETWFVFAEAPASGDGPSVVYAARPDGSIVRRLYSSGGSDSGVDAIIGWLSESSFLGVEPVEFCNRSLYSYNVVSGERERLLGWNSAGVLGDDGTIMLAIYQGGPCAYEWPQGLYRLTSAGGWAPQRILGTGDATSLGEVKWMPRAGLFAVCEGYQGESQLVLRSTNGQAVDSFACSDRLYPSPDGTSIVVSKRDGTLELEPARRAQRIPISRLPVKDVVWLPGGDGFVATTEDGRLWAAESAHDWHPVQLASGIDPARMPVVVQPPQASFELPCPSAPGSRLHVGDRAKVSSVPPVSSRLRESPGVDAAPSGSLGPGTAVRILEGPVCAGGRVWWRVGADDGSQAGWTVESDWQGAWLVAP